MGYFCYGWFPVMLWFHKILCPETIVLIQLCATHDFSLPLTHLATWDKFWDELYILPWYCEPVQLEMEQNLQWWPKFNNLTTLTLGNRCLYGDFYPLIFFLQNSPNLEQLTLELMQRFRQVRARFCPHVSCSLYKSWCLCHQDKTIMLLCCRSIWTKHS
jgi:hypothetical protein